MEKSQIVVTKEIRQITSDFKLPIKIADLIVLRDRLFSVLKIIAYNEKVSEQEKEIRWKRTASEILSDGYVYDGKACTDLTISFIALCNSLGLPTRFVKLKKGTIVHSVAEVRLDDGWYIFDVSNKKNIPQRGEITVENSYDGWFLWKKGRDAWDLDLIDFDSIRNIK